MDEATRILIVEDVAADAELARREIGSELTSCSFRVVETREEFLDALETFAPDIIVSDYSLPVFDGMTALKLAHEYAPTTPVIILTGSQNEDIAVTCIKAGAADYVLKESIKRLGPAVTGALDNKRIREEKELAEASLRENQERYRIITENMRDTVWITDMDFRTSYISPSVVATRGYTLEELREMPLDKHVTPESMKIVSKIITENLTPERLAEARLPLSETVELEFYRKDGSTFWSEITMTIIRDAEGKPVGFLGVGRDITERRDAERAMRESERKYRELIENVADIVYVTDGRGTIMFLNGAGQRFFGYTLQESVGHSFAEFLVPSSYGTAADIFKRQLDGQDVGAFELDFYNRTGEVRTLETREELVWENGRVAEVHGIGRDISERKSVQEKLRELSTRYVAILDAVNDIIMEVDVHKVYTWANHAGFEFFGEDVIGKEASAYFAGQQNTYETVDPIFEGSDEVYYVESWQRRKDGEARLLAWWCRALKDKNGIVTGSLSSARDITEQNAAEEALRESEERYRNLLELAPVGIAVQSEGKVVFTNSAGARIVGAQSPEEVTGRDIGTIIHPDYVDTSRDRIRRMMAGEQGLYPDENVYVKLDGTLVPVDVIAAPITYGGKPAVQIIATDISKRKEAERAIRESEERYRDLVETIADIIYVTDGGGKIIYLNRALERISGYTHDELLQKNYMELLTPESLEKVKEVFKSQKRGDDIGSYEISFVDKNGNIKIMEVREQVVWEGKRIVQVRGIGRDITERKHAQERIAHLNHVLESIRTIDKLIVRVDNRGTLLAGACEILCEVSGYYFVWIGLVEEGHERVVPAAHWGYEQGYLDNITVTWDDSPTGRGPIGTAIRTGRPCVFNDTAGNPDFGPWRDEALKRGYRSLMAVPVTIGKRVYGALSVYSDRPDFFDYEEVTLIQEVGEEIAFAMSAIEAGAERNRSEEALRESEEKFRSFFETSRDIVFITALDGTILDINKAFEDILGYTREETIGTVITLLYRNTEDQERFSEAVDGFGFVKDFEVAVRRKDGTFADCLITATARRTSGGTIVGYQGTVRDISEKKRMERQLIQAEKLSSLGGILSGVAHEMNNPLTSIIGISQMIVRGPVPEDIREKLDVIHRESLRTSKIIQGLLTFAREHKPERKMVSINKIIEESHRLREYEFRVDNIGMKLELAKDVPFTAADPYQLQQVFINLINNSHDALTDGGGSQLVIRSFVRNGTICIEFEDDGPGISEQDIEFIFDPFFTTKEVGKGTGLGLSIVYGIIKEHGGRIEVNSAPGRGAKFAIYLQVTMEITEQTAPLPQYARKPRGKKSIMVVEDEEPLRKMVGEVLEQNGYQVQECEGGQQAIDMMKVRRFDAIVTDLKMPGIGGKELYTFVQKYYPDLAQRVVFITGDVLNKDTQAFFRITGNIYIEKPFEIEVLLARVGEALEL